MARRCPLCRAEIIGGGFPVHPLKEVASALVTNHLIEPSSTTISSYVRMMEFQTMTFSKEPAEAKHIHALQIGCYSQSQLANHSVLGIVAAITHPQWVDGVYVLFEAAVSRVFFETFATVLHGKAGGVNVLVNSAQRMLAVQLADRNAARRPVDAHTLVKVATDGRFTVGVTPEATKADGVVGSAAASASVPAAAVFAGVGVGVGAAAAAAAIPVPVPPQSTAVPMT
jgi:hypothetical protein